MGTAGQPDPRLTSRLCLLSAGSRLTVSIKHTFLKGSWTSGSGSSCFASFSAALLALEAQNGAPPPTCGGRVASA